MGFCLGAAAAWWPTRNDNTIGDAEADVAVVDFTETGISLQTNLVGCGGSSTRTEIAGGIMAIASPHPPT